jgi:hypothetical protein
MTYRISYEDGWAANSSSREGGVTRTESFRTEHEALCRARELVDSDIHHAVSFSDESGAVLTGVRLQLKLGASVAE